MYMTGAANFYQDAIVDLRIFDFTDYRHFLRTYYKEKKKKNPGFSYRIICDNVGIKSTGHLTLILNGKANISVQLALKFAGYLKLKKKACDYFQYMVLFNQAKNHDDKRIYFEKMRAFKESSVYLVESIQYEYYSKWYHSAIRALLEFFPFKKEFKEIAGFLVPHISPEEAKRSIALMERLGIIKKDECGFYRPTDAIIDTGSEAKSVAINNYIDDTIGLARKAIDTFPGEKRRYSWVTLGISEQGFDSIIHEIREFRKRIYEIAVQDRADSVYQLNIQLYPLSEKYKKGREW